MVTSRKRYSMGDMIWTLGSGESQRVPDISDNWNKGQAATAVRPGWRRIAELATHDVTTSSLVRQGKGNPRRF